MLLVTRMSRWYAYPLAGLFQLAHPKGRLMNEHEAITRAEAWYLQRYHAVAHGHLPVDVVGQEVREDPFLCIDLVPEQETEVIRVLLELMGEEVALLEEGSRCPRCTAGYEATHQRWLGMWRRSWLHLGGKHRQHSACLTGAADN